MIIYKATNKADGKTFIGSSTKSFGGAISKHQTNAFVHLDKSPFHSALRELGMDAFHFEFLGKCENSEIDNVLEGYILEFDSVENGYNVNIDDHLDVDDIEPAESVTGDDSDTVW